MPLSLLKRLPPLRTSEHQRWLRDWQVSDQITEAEGRSSLAMVSACTPAQAATITTGPELPVVLRAGLGPGTASEPDALQWLPASRAKFNEAISALASKPGQFWLWPSANGVLSDVPSTASFFRAKESSPFRLFLDPASLLTPDMLPKAEDHLARILQGLAGQATAILLANVEPSGGIEGVQLAPLTRGALSPRLIVDLWRHHAAQTTPVVILDQDVPAQQALLGM